VDVRRIWVVMALLVGCTGEEIGLDDTDGGDTRTTDCTGAEPYVAGISSTAPSGMVVEIVDADPTPPDVGDNTWTLSVTDGGGAAVPGLTPRVVPWMPLHGHGLVPARYDAVDQGDGTYMVDTFDLIMPGLWEFTVNLGAGTETPDEVVFSFCAEG
jgi:hypothetical protein